MRLRATIAAALVLFAAPAFAQNVAEVGGSVGGVGSISLGAVSINQPILPTTINAAAPGVCPANQYETQDTTTGPVCAQPSFAQLTGTASNSQLAGPLVSLLAVPAQFTISNPGGVGTATVGYTANSLVAHNFGTGIDLTGKLTGAQPAFGDISGTLGTGQFTATTCTNQFVSALSNSGAATCTTDTLASAQHANQGTTTTVLHGNAAGNPSWASVADADLANGYSGTGACGANTFASTLSRNAAPTCTQPTSTGLSDFTSGPWTPGVAFGGATTGITFSAQAGQFIKIGKLVIASFDFTLSSKGTATGTATITGLPQASNASTGGGGFVSFYANFAIAPQTMTLNVDAGGTVAHIGVGGAASVTLLNDTSFSSTTRIIGTAVYIST